MTQVDVERVYIRALVHRCWRTNKMHFITSRVSGWLISLHGVFAITGASKSTEHPWYRFRKVRVACQWGRILYVFSAVCVQVKCFHPFTSLFCVSCSGFRADSAAAAETVSIATIVSTANMESPTPRPGNAYATTANVYILYVRWVDLTLR